MFRFPTIIAGLALLVLASPAAADPVDDLVARYMAASHIPGAAVAVIEDGRVAKLAGYGLANVEWNGAVTPDTPFQTASASKIFAGVVLMRLVEQGRLSLDDPISRFVENAPESWSRITIRHLAGHMSGLPEGLGLPSGATAREMVAEAMRRPLAYEPGSESRYGLTDFVTMTLIMEQVSGLSYPELVRREIVEPLGLTHTGFTMLSEAGPVRSAMLMAGRARVYGYRDGVQRDEEFIYPIRAYAAGGLYSSARDLATLMMALTSGRLLRPESFALLTSPVRLADGSDGAFGVGWTFGRYHGLATVGHTGGPALADVMYVPSRRLTVIVLTNQRRFYPLLAQSIADLSLPPEPGRTAIADVRPDLSDAMRAMLTEAADGRLDPGRFTERGRQNWLPFYQDFGQAMLIAVGPVRTISLLSERPQGDAVRRLYRVTFERRAIDFVMRADADGRFDEIRPLSGDDE